MEKEKEKTEEERTKYQSIQQDMTTFQQERSQLLSQHNDAVRIKELKMKEEQKNDQNLKENLKKKFNNKIFEMETKYVLFFFFSPIFHNKVFLTT